LLYIIAIYLFAYSIIAYILLRDVLSPSVIVGLSMTFGTAVAISSNAKWAISVPVEVVIVYLLGTLSLLVGELLAGKKVLGSYKVSRSKVILNYPQISYVKIPFRLLFISLLFSITVSYFYGKKAISIAWAYGFTNASWQSLQDYIKNAMMYGGAHIGMGLASAYAISTVLTYIFIQIYVVNVGIKGWRYTFKRNWYYLLMFLPYIYTQFIQGQRTGYIGMFSFILYNYFFSYYSKKNKKISTKTFVRYATVAIVVFYVVFLISGIRSGRLKKMDSLESIRVYTGSSIIDCADYFNRGGILNKGFGVSTFKGLRNTISRFVPLNGESNLGWVRMANGSRSNVYGAFTSYYSDFSYLGVIIIPTLLGFIYKLMHNKAKSDQSTFGALYAYSYISYGIVMSFIDEQQLRLFMSVGQIMHVVVAVVLLKLVVNRYAKN